MSWVGWLHLLWNPLFFLYLYICFLFQDWEVFIHNFLKYIFYSLLSLFSFLNTYDANVGMLNVTSEIFNFFFIWLISAALICWFPLLCLPDHLFLLLSCLFCYSLLLAWFLSHQLNYLIFIWFIFIVFSSLLQCLELLSIIFLNLFSIFVIFWAWGLVGCWDLINYLFSQKIYLVI